MTNFSNDPMQSMPKTVKVVDSITLFDTIGSTNTYAQQALAQGAYTSNKSSASNSDDTAMHNIAMHAIVANEQTAGRGRLSRNWVSVPGASFLVSYVTILPSQVVLDRQYNGWLPTIAGLCARNAIEAVVKEHGMAPLHDDQCRLQIKWPNDIYLDDCKVGGVLTELVTLANTSEAIGVIFGIGLNLCVPKETLPIEHATSLQLHFALSMDAEALRDAIAEHIAKELRARLELFSRDRAHYAQILLKEVEAVSWTLGRDVVVHPVNTQPYEGKAVSLGVDASLTLQQADGTKVTVDSGDVVAVAYDAEYNAEPDNQRFMAGKYTNK